MFRDVVFQRSDDSNYYEYTHEVSADNSSFEEVIQHMLENGYEIRRKKSFINGQPKWFISVEANIPERVKNMKKTMKKI